MCGITGFWTTSWVEPNILDKMTDRLAHRGPDDCGGWIDVEAGIALGHRRLAVLDLSPTGHQPMASASGRYIITYNGEIYNFLEIRAALPDYPFRGLSDTEVMLAAIETWRGRKGTSTLYWHVRLCFMGQSDKMSGTGERPNWRKTPLLCSNESSSFVWF